MRERHDAIVQREFLMDVQQLTRNGDLMVPVSVVCWVFLGDLLSQQNGGG